MNLHHRCSWDISTCKKCHKTMTIAHKKTSLFTKVFYAIAWMFPAMVLIGLTATGCMDYKTAIGLVIVYHFVSFVWIIGLGNYSRV